jgi:uncharacterized protein
MNAISSSTESRPAKERASIESVGRDSVEPIGNDTARNRLLSRPGEPLFYANWDNLVFIHYETDAEKLQACIPYDLDLYGGRAFVSLVAFTMRGMRPRFGGSLGALLFKPIATHHFLNLRTYVRHKGEPGIYFMREWLSNRIAAWLGPWSFGLPYRFGKIEYRNDPAHTHECRGKVEGNDNSLGYCATVRMSALGTCAAESLDEFLLERYTAFTKTGRHCRFFRIWHEPWQQVAANVEILADDLIRSDELWWWDARCIGANYAPGVSVWMGWPHKIETGANGQLTSVSNNQPFL